MGRRKQHHEEHANHEAWAIPYGDLITLLLAFFVVMYAVSSVNEGKYRVLSDSLMAAFRGQPKTYQPIQLGNVPMRSAGSSGAPTSAGVSPSQAMKLQNATSARSDDTVDADRAGEKLADAGDTLTIPLLRMAEEFESAMKALIEKNLISVTRNPLWVEVEIKDEVLFPSGSAEVSADATEILGRMAEILAPLPNPVRVEGRTDTRPISNYRFPSNWELSAARAARIVRLFEESGVDPARMTAAGMGEYHPVAGNDSAEGRSRNRRRIIRGGSQMSGLDHINPSLPSHLVRRPQEQKKRRETGTGQKRRRPRNIGPDRRPDSREHLIDELA